MAAEVAGQKQASVGDINRFALAFVEGRAAFGQLDFDTDFLPYAFARFAHHQQREWHANFFQCRSQCLQHIQSGTGRVHENGGS